MKFQFQFQYLGVQSVVSFFAFAVFFLDALEAFMAPRLPAKSSP